jgi:hypothetical protein
MVDIEKQSAFWRSSAEEDWDVACQLVANERTRHGLFFAHLALEKILQTEKGSDLFSCKSLLAIEKIVKGN